MTIEPKDVSIKLETTDDAIEIGPLIQLQFKDGARVRSLDGAVLTRTSLVLSMNGYLSHLKGLVELDKDGGLKIVVLETLIVRREQDDASRSLSSMQTELLVENGQIIEPRTPVTKTQVLSIDDSTASIKQSAYTDVRRLLLVSAKNEQIVLLECKATVKVCDLFQLDDVVVVSSENTIG